MRLVQSLVSHASLVYDERLFMKSYRVLEPAPRPEIELLFRLDEVGFKHLLGAVARWERSGWDLALVREYVPGAVEGRPLALTSLRDLLGRASSTRTAPHSRRSAPPAATSPRRCAASERSPAASTWPSPRPSAFARSARRRRRPCAAIRVHGDYHLRRVLRTDAGWIVAGFGDDPLIGKFGDSGERQEPRYASPLEDLADLSYSLRQVAAEAVAAQPAAARAQAERSPRPGSGATGAHS